MGLAALLAVAACGGGNTHLGGDDDDAALPVDGDADASGPDGADSDGDRPDAGDAEPDGPDGGDADVSEAEADLWIPPIEDAGEAGWRDSETPWVPPPVAHCDIGLFAGTPLDLWSDPDGVYVLYGWQDVHEVPGGGWTVDTPPLLGVWHNVGDGWTEFYRGEWSGCWPECDMQIGGFIDGWLLAWMPRDTVYGLAPGVMEQLWPELYGVGPDLVVVNDDLAYTSWQAGGDARIIRWNGSAWSPIPVPLPFSEAYQARLWADEDDLFVAGPYAILLSFEGGDWRIHDAGSLTNFTALWGFGGDDVWVGGSRGELKHYDGVSWADIAWPSLETESTCVEPTPIRGMWGADGVLYFVTSTQFARWDGARVEVLGYWPDRWDPADRGGTCVPELRLVALWGNSPTEVFLVVARPLPEGFPAYCNDIAVLLWDGTTFHRI